MRNSQSMPWLGEVADIPDFMTVTSATYTVKAQDYGKTIICNSASAQVITIPLLGLGFNVHILQIGAGSVTVAAGTGATITGPITLTRYTPTKYIAYTASTYTATGSAAPVGTTPVGTVTIQEYGDAYSKTAVLTLTNFIVGALAGAGASLGLGNIVYTFPAGEHVEISYFQSLSLTAAGTAVNATTGLGSVIASGAISVLSGTATFQDRLTGQVIPTAAAGGAVTNKTAVATAGALTGIAINAAASVKNVFLNSAGVWNANNTGNLTATGTIVLAYQRMLIS
jgi:hypothetical protein